MVLNKKGRILVVAEKKREVYQSLISALMEKFIVKELYAVSDHDKPPLILVRWISLIKNWKKVSKRFNPDKVVICGGSLISVCIIVFLIRLLQLKVEIILFRYDIEHFWPYPKGLKQKLNHFIALILEKICLLNADKIMHKGLKKELEFLPFYDNIKDKPHYLFREFLNKNMIQKSKKNIKLSKKDGELHLVYIGGLYFGNLPAIESFWRFYPKITTQKIHLHIYSKQPERVVKEFRGIEAKDKYFHYEGYKKHGDLVRDLTKYDYGIHIFGNGIPKKTELVYKIAFSNKNFDYIAAKLPIIASTNLLATKKLVRGNNLGVIINYSRLSGLKKVLRENPPHRFKSYISKFLNKQDYSRLNMFIKR